MPEPMLNVLLTNDDGIEAEGLQAMRRALARARRASRLAVDRARRQPLGDGALDHDAPAAVGGGGAVRRRHGRLRDRRHAGRLRAARAASGWSRASTPDLVVSGINHGANLGDDITYSGTVAAALEGVVLGLPAIAVSQQSGARALDYRFDGGFGFERGGGVRRAAGRADRGRAAAGRHAAQRQRARRASRAASR